MVMVFFFRFISCCSLSPLLEQLQASDQLKAGISPSGEAWQVQPDVITLKLKEQEAVFDMQGKKDRDLVFFHHIKMKKTAVWF